MLPRQIRRAFENWSGPYGYEISPGLLERTQQVLMEWFRLGVRLEHVSLFQHSGIIHVVYASEWNAYCYIFKNDHVDIQGVWSKDIIRSLSYDAYPCSSSLARELQKYIF